jgi:uncharacterized phiE125 gp8 family phage protein
LLTPPTSEPVLLQEAKDWMRVSDSSQDSVITSLISAARWEAEKYTRRSFISTQWKQQQDTFPPTGLGQVNLERLQFWSYNNAGEVVLPRSPLITVDTVAYQDANGSTITMTAGTDYVVDLNPDHGRIFLPFGKIWPITYPQQNAVSLTFTAGYGATAAAVPEGLKTVIKMLVANWFENREPVLTSGAVPQILPLHIRDMLWTYRTLDF